jgi:hypothetical protein
VTPGAPSWALTASNMTLSHGLAALGPHTATADRVAAWLRSTPQAEAPA